MDSPVDSPFETAIIRPVPGGLGIVINAGYAPGYGRKEYSALALLDASVLDLGVLIESDEMFWMVMDDRSRHK